MRYCEECSVPNHVAGICPKCEKGLCISHYTEHMNRCAGQRQSGEHGYARPIPDVFRGWSYV